MGVKIFDGATDDLGGGTLQRNEDQEKALEDAVALKKEEEKHLEQNKGLRVALRPIKALNIMKELLSKLLQKNLLQICHIIQVV